MTTYLFLVWQTYFFFLLYANTVEIVHTCIGMQNTNAHKVLSDSLNDYTLVGHICLFISVIS